MRFDVWSSVFNGTESFLQVWVSASRCWIIASVFAVRLGVLPEGCDHPDQYVPMFLSLIFWELLQPTINKPGFPRPCCLNVSYIAATDVKGANHKSFCEWTVWVDLKSVRREAFFGGFCWSVIGQLCFWTEWERREKGGRSRWSEINSPVEDGVVFLFVYCCPGDVWAAWAENPAIRTPLAPSVACILYEWVIITSTLHAGRRNLYTPMFLGMIRQLFGCFGGFWQRRL